MSAVTVAAAAIALVACNGGKENNNGSNQASTSMAASDKQVVDNSDEVTFLKSFLNNYIKLNGKPAQELARKHLTEEFYSRYIELCNNKSDAVDLILEVAIDEKVEKIDTIMKGIEDPSSYIVRVEATGTDGQPFNTQYDMTVVKENGKCKLGGSQIVD